MSAYRVTREKIKYTHTYSDVINIYNNIFIFTDKYYLFLIDTLVLRRKITIYSDTEGF